MVSEKMMNTTFCWNCQKMVKFITKIINMETKKVCAECGVVIGQKMDKKQKEEVIKNVCKKI